MKIQINVLLNTPIESADWLLTYSQKTLTLLREIQEVHYEKGSEADFGEGTVLRLKGFYNNKNWSSKAEILEYQQGKFITQRFSDDTSTTVIKTTLSREGNKTLLRVEGEVKLNSALLGVIAPLIARGLRKIYLKRYGELARHFDPLNENHSISVQVSVAGLPYWFAYILLFLGTVVGLLLILKAFGV